MRAPLISIVVAGILTCLGCTGADLSGRKLRGTILAEPLPKPDFSLLSTSGEPFDFRQRTDGRLTLLFFGFTHCPDVCPVHLHNLAAVLPTLDPAVARKITVVFVSTDPERDTAHRLRTWLDGFSAEFVGLRGPIDSVNAIQRTLGLPPAVEQPRAEGGYTVGHAAQVLAFTPDDRAWVVYPFGTRQTDWAHDLPMLAAGRWRGSSPPP